MNLWQKIKKVIKRIWSGGGNGGGNTSNSSPRAGSSGGTTTRRVSSASSGGQYSFNRRNLLDSLRGGEKSSKQASNNNAYKASENTFKHIAKPESSPYKRMAESSDKTKEELRAKLKKLETERKEFHKDTGNKYNTKTGDEEHDRKAYALRHGGYGSASPEVQKHSVKYHPTITTAARAISSGVTGGATELAISKLSNKDKERAEAEKYYQKHKDKTAETIGELAGSLVFFGGTAGATEKAAAKLTSKVAPKAAERLAEKQIIKSAAKRSVDKAVKKGLVSEASEELVKQVGKDKAKKIVGTLGTDVVQNLTTGALYDINKASAEHEVGSEDWWKELGKSAALNFGITGAVAGASAVKGGKRLATEAATRLDARRGLRELADSRAGASRIQAPRIGESIEDRIARVNAERLGANANEVAEPLVRNADEIAETTAKNVDDGVERVINDIDAEIEEAHRVAGDVNATAEERRAAADRFDELVEERERIVGDAEAGVFDEQAYKESLDDVIPFTDEPTAEARALSDEVPFAGVDDAMPSTDPALTAENEARDALEKRVGEIAEQGAKEVDDSLKVNKVAPDEAISKDLPSGVKQVRSAYEYNNGEEPKIEGGTLTKWKEAWKALNEYSASHAKGEKRRMSKVGITQLNAMDSNAERELRDKLVEQGLMDYDAISTPELYDKVAKQMRDDADRYVKEMIEINEGGALDFRSTPEWQARVQYIMGTIDPSADEASEIAYTEAFKLAQNISSKSGQTLNLRRNFVHLTPMGKRDAILDDLINILQKSKGFSKNHPAMRGLGHFDKREYIRKILTDDEGIMNGVEKLVKTDDLDGVSEAFTELMLNLNKKNPKVAFDVLQELRYLNMLGNPKTHIRNVFGSAFFSPMRQTSNMIRSFIENPIAEYATKQAGVKMNVTRHGRIWDVSLRDVRSNNPTTEAGKAAKEAYDRMRTEILGGAKYDTLMYKGRGKTAAGKALDTLSDFNSNLLSKEDDFFRSRAFKENYIKSYNRYLKDGKPITEKVKRQIEKEALEESRIATFNEYNNFAKFLNSITSKANDANASALARWGGRGVNAVMPFTKVPANLMKQSVNYSPLGIAKGFANIKTAAARGDSAMLNKAIDELSSGLTGSAVFGLGMLLGNTTDMFTTNAGKNDPAAKFKKDRGMQNYSITFKDPETGQGHSFTLDWLVPTSATFFSGVEMANQLKGGDFNILDIGGDWSDVVTRLAEPVMETSMLSGLHGMLETMRSGSRDDDTKSAIGVLLRETVQSYMNSLMPTAMGQAARTAYKSDKQVVGDTDWEYFRNQAKVKTGLAADNALTRRLGIEPLGADTDVFGNVKNEKNSTEDYVKAGLKNFLSPANIQKVDFSAVDEQKLAEYEEAVKNGADPQEMAYLFPKKQYKKQFKVAGDEVKMSNRDLSTYNQAKTTGGEEGMRYALENIMFNRRTTDANGKNVPRDDAYTPAMKKALMNQFKGKSMREVEEWVYAQPEFESASPAEKKRLISGLWSLDSTFDSKANASRRVGEQAVIRAQGGDVDEYNFKNEITEKKREALMPAIKAGYLTYAQAVDFNRDAAKMGYYETEDGGYSKASYNREGILNFLDGLDAPEEAKKALYDAYYTGKTPYGESVRRGRSGYRRRGYRRRSGYRRYSGGSRKSSVPALKQSDYKASNETYKSIASTLTPRTTSTKKTASRVKIEPPKVKFKEYEV